MIVESKFLSQFSKESVTEEDIQDSLDDYLDEILPQIKQWSEDIYEFEEKGYFRNRWLEIRDSDNALEAVLHLFREEGEYLLSVDGDIIVRGRWQAINESNSMIIDKMVGGGVAQSEFYDLAFLNNDFFILKKHGDQRRKGNKKYLMFGREGMVRGLEWREVVELLFNNVSGNPWFIFSLVVLGLLVAIAVYFYLA